MQLSQIPTRMQKVWGTDASGAYIRTVPVDSQVGVQDGAASFSTGFVPDNFTPVAGGGVPPFGQDFNGVLNAITAWLQWGQAGGPLAYNSAFAAAISGYPAGAVLASAVTPGAQWCSIVDGNTTNPDDPLTSSGWIRVGLPVGTPVPILSATTPGGLVIANGTTLGSAASGSAQASDANLFLFKAIWDQFSNTQCPIFDSSGSASTRGANAVADFLANKRLTTPNMKGLGVIGVDTMGGSATTFLSGVPVTIGNATTPGSILGENFHTLLTAEIAAHAHGVTDPTHTHNFFWSNNSSGTTATLTDITFQGSSGVNVGGGGSFGPQTAVSIVAASTGISIQSAGGGGSHNTVHRNMAAYWGLKT